MLHAQEGSCLAVHNTIEAAALGSYWSEKNCCHMVVPMPTFVVGLKRRERLFCHAGSRRSIILVEALRSADITAHSHVESVAAVVAALPDLAERCSFEQLPPGAPESAGSSSGGSLDTSQVCLPALVHDPA